MIKKLSTRGEVEVFEQISPIANRYQATVYRKVRIADVIDISQLGPRSLSSYALAAHFDFVVADEAEQPQFALEFDGPGTRHRTITKKMKFAAWLSSHCFEWIGGRLVLKRRASDFSNT